MPEASPAASKSARETAATVGVTDPSSPAGARPSATRRTPSTAIAAARPSA
ncbi:hypothetical protein BC477_17340 [Clavibacter michiganensis subsp. michiganensis]|nr:hypothetical protein BC477_17340 [Clavibacter michiganensis subsp. michiganensis]